MRAAFLHACRRMEPLGRRKKEGALSHDTNTGTHNASEASSDGSGLLERARKRTDREKRLADPVHAAHYTAASLGQSPYVALPNVGIIVVQRSGWGC